MIQKKAFKNLGVSDGFLRTTGQAYTRSFAASPAHISCLDFSSAQVVPPYRQSHNHCEARKCSLVQAKSGSTRWVTHNAAREANISGDVHSPQ